MDILSPKSLPVICLECNEEFICSNLTCPNGHRMLENNEVFLKTVASGIDNFDYYWEKFGGKFSSKRIEFAKEILDQEIEIKPSKVVDLGCGDGLYLNLISDYFNPELLVGLDISKNALIKANKNCPNAILFQSNSENLFFKKNFFDLVLSIGVLNYLDKPLESVIDMLSIVKPGGNLVIWIYPGNLYTSSKKLKFLRKILQLVPKPATKLIYAVIVLMLPLLPTSTGISLRNSSWKECMESVVVSILPKQDYLSIISIVTKIETQDIFKVDFFDIQKGLLWIKKI